MIDSTFRVAIASLWHETNTYGPRTPNFEEYEFVEGEDMILRHSGSGSVVGGFLEGCEEFQWRVLPALAAGAWPSGPASRGVFESILARLQGILEAICQVGPLDGVLLNLHGAMVADGHPDVEGEVTTAVRAAVGTSPISTVVDFHANPSAQLTRASDTVVAYDTYPHVDMRERGREAAFLLNDMMGGARLRTTLARVPLLISPLAQATESEPFSGVIRRGKRRAQEAGLRRLSLCGGFAYSDVARAGASALVIHDRTVSQQARIVARDTLSDLLGCEGELKIARDSPVDAVRRLPRGLGAPVVLVDVGDNVGGGSAGDSTVLLKELMSQRVEGVVTIVADSQVVSQARQAGVGHSIRAWLGGKSDSFHGPPMFFEGIIEALTDGEYTARGSWGTGQRFCMGPCAVLRSVDDRCTVLVSSRAVPPFHGEQLTQAGIDPLSARVIVAKGAVAWRAAYGDLAAAALEVNTPGACPLDPTTLPRHQPPVGYGVTTSARERTTSCG